MLYLGYNSLHRAQNNYETAAQYNESALDGYLGDFDWIDTKVQKNLIQIIGAKLEHGKERSITSVSRLIEMILIIPIWLPKPNKLRITSMLGINFESKNFK